MKNRDAERNKKNIDIEKCGQEVICRRKKEGHMQKKKKVDRW